MRHHSIVLLGAALLSLAACSVRGSTADVTKPVCGNNKCEAGEWPTDGPAMQSCPKDCPRKQKACDAQKKKVASVLHRAEKCKQDSDCERGGNCLVINKNMESAYSAALQKQDELCGRGASPGGGCGIVPKCTNHVCTNNGH